MYILGILISTLLRMHYYNCYNGYFIGGLLPFNNGILEGTVNRIKNIKRMMFGKAGERLLKMKLILNSST